MTTSPTTFALSKPTGRERVAAGVLEYFQTRNRLHAFSLVQQEFEKSGITQADLAARMGKGSDRINHLLSAPGNWTLDTVSDLLFAISGAEVLYGADYPLERPSRNMVIPEWINAVNLDQPKTVQITLSSTSTSEVLLARQAGSVISLLIENHQVPQNVGT